MTDARRGAGGASRLCLLGMSSSNLSFCLPALHSTAHLGSPPTHGTRRWLGTLIAWGSVGRSTRYWFAPGILDADWLVQVPNSLRLLPSLPFLPFPPLTLPKFTPMDFARRAILARLPGRQYQRDAFPNTTAHAHPFGSGTNPWPVLQQWPSSGGGQEETLLTLARCVYWNFFFLLLF
ncbi:hypothetical protein F5882DRAFT_120541 [Hyaloscypha sp. PMI_1271]|nr:hypothetical protein F5882DRAFT_120541 [Hyaloscypha sp. PMI_1271]